MSYTVIPTSVAGSGGLYTADSITSTTNGPPTINATTATHITDGCVPGDAAVITLSASNNGTYIVVAVLSETAIEVYPALPVPGGASGTLSIRQPAHDLTITDEATISCTSIASAMSALDSRLFFKTFGTVDNSASGPDFSCFIHLFQTFSVTYTTASLSTWTTKSEVISNYYNRTIYVGTALSNRSMFWQIFSKTGSTGSLLLVAGELATSDYRSARLGSVFVNGGPIVQLGSTKMATQLYDSKFMGGNASESVSTGSYIVGTEGHVYSCSFGSQLGLVGTQSLRIKNTQVLSPNATPIFVAATPVLDITNLLVGDGNNSSMFIIFSNVTLPGLDFSDTVSSVGLFSGVGASLSLDDVAQDFPMSTLFATTSGCTFLKRYTFNPRFIQVNNKGISAPIPGLQIKVEKVGDGHYLNVVTGATGTWSLVINGATVNITGDASASVVAANAVTAINAAVLGVTASAAANGGQIAGAQPVIVLANVVDAQFSISVNPPPGAGAWTLDPAPTAATPAAGAPDDYRSVEVSGSPFTTDSNGRINTSGIKALRAIQAESSHTRRSINVQLKVTVEGVGYETQVFYFAPTIAFAGDFPVQQARMGNLK